MDYNKHYQLLMTRGKQRLSSISRDEAKIKIPYRVERHRILPGCMGGQYVLENVAWLTPEEHFLAHQLLVKIYPESTSILFACVSMTRSATDSRVNNKHYAWLKRRQSELQVVSNKQRVWTEESKRKLGAAHTGKKLSEEHKRALVEANRGKSKSEDVRSKISSSLKGKSKTQEHKKKMSDAKKGVSHNNGNLISQALKGKVKTEEHKQKLREAAKQRWANKRK